MERGLVIFGILFLALPALLAVLAMLAPTLAFGATLGIIALLTLGFALGIAFVDIDVR